MRWGDITLWILKLSELLKTTTAKPLKRPFRCGKMWWSVDISTTFQELSFWGLPLRKRHKIDDAKPRFGSNLSQIDRGIGAEF